MFDRIENTTSSMTKTVLIYYKAKSVANIINRIKCRCLEWPVRARIVYPKYFILACLPLLLLRLLTPSKSDTSFSVSQPYYLAYEYLDTAPDLTERNKQIGTGDSNLEDEAFCARRMIPVSLEDRQEQSDCKSVGSCVS